MEAEKILSRLTVKQKDFFFSFLKAEAISFESIVDLQSLQNIIKGLKDKYKAIEDSKSIKKWIDLIDVQDRISGAWKVKRKPKSKVIIEGKTDNEVKHIIKKQNNIVSIIKVLENKILPEVEIYNQFSLTKTKVNKNKARLADNENLLVDAILKIVLGNEINKYSTRKFEKILKNNDYTIDHSTIANKLRKQSFRLLLYASIMRKKEIEKRKDKKDKLDTFEKWLKDNYDENRIEAAQSKYDRKAGKSGVYDMNEIEEDFLNQTEL